MNMNRYNTYNLSVEEALAISNEIDFCNDNTYDNCHTKYKCSDIDKAKDIITEALEKQIPMPIRVTASTKRCGRCNRQLSGIGNSHPERSYCPGCGQAIKWED